MANMRVAVLSANLGGYDVPRPWPALESPLGVTIDVHRFTDENFPPRPLAMTSRLMCGAVKWFGPSFVPGADIYLWMDASVTPTPIAVQWFMERLGDAEMAVFRHPHRRTIREEYEFMKARMARPGEKYLNSRYRDEWMDEEYAYIQSLDYRDDALYASTAFIYRPTERVGKMGKEQWFAKTRWLLHDQLYWPVAIAMAGCRVNVIEDNYLKCQALEYTRNKQRKSA